MLSGPGRVPADVSMIHLIGVVHHDPAGIYRLLAALSRAEARFGRAVTAVEVSWLSLVFRRSHGPALVARLGDGLAEAAARSGRPVEELWAHPYVARLVGFLKPPAEFTAARRWAGPGRVRLIEPAASSRRELALCWELFSTANLAAALAGEVARPSVAADRHYARARRSLPGGTGIEPQPEREAALAEQLVRLTERHGRIIHIGGWTHLPGLLRRLSFLSPTWDLAEPPGEPVVRPA